MMAQRQLGWAIFLAGLPFAHFLLRPLDIWHGQAAWAQGWVALLFGTSVCVAGRARSPQPALGTWVAWTLGTFLWTWTQTVITQKLYPLPMALGVLHALSAVGFVLAAQQDWDEAFLTNLTRWLVGAGVLCGLLGVLQLLSLDPFYKNLDPNPVEQKKDIFVGTIGNPSHFGAQLACLLPLAWMQTGRRWKVVWGGFVLLLAVCHSTVALLAALVGMLYLCGRSRRWLWLGVGVAGGGVALWLWHDALNPEGRLVAWRHFYELMQGHPLAGWGIGFIMDYSRTVTDPHSPVFQWRHVHNEWLQLGIEQGVVGLGLVLWLVWSWWQKARTLTSPLGRALTAMGLAFLVNACINFPMHLWLLASYGLVAYAGVYVLSEEG